MLGVNAGAEAAAVVGIEDHSVGAVVEVAVDDLFIRKIDVTNVVTKVTTPGIAEFIKEKAAVVVAEVVGELTKYTYSVA